jgi:hypothetical protein
MKKYDINGKYVDITLDNDKVVRVETAYLDNMVETLEISFEEAVLTYLEDEEYEINDEQEELTKKAKDNRITATIHEAEDRTKERKKTVRTIKENPTKEMVIAEMAKCIGAIDGVSNCRIENKAKIITFELNGESFKVDLIQRRAKKN